MKHDLRAVGRGFRLEGTFEGAESWGQGHINDSYRVTYRRGGESVRYIQQRINHAVFRDPPALMDNMRRVLDHLQAKLGHLPDASRRVMRLVPANDGKPYVRDEDGNFWRAYRYIDGGRTREVVENPRQALESAKAFGRFQALLADLPGPRLHVTIPDFHHTPKRFAALEDAAARDLANRAARARPELEFALGRKAMTSVLEDLLESGNVPERIAHNDTKADNVIVDESTAEGLCVIDLDTVMPGLALHDFGDMVRTATSPAAEDERDLSRVRMRLPMFEALVRGYLAGAGELLNACERKHLAFSGKLMAFEVGVRFLTDFLAGDAYFKVRREDHNLDRCRAQFALVRSIEEQEEAMNLLVERLGA
ncbi:MAG: aminoglycoside phosphotransferase family protein [Elusimicrobia bacterium]|nr:aminoglycoside phosphotransferase family protein [Elusimicrobiota bacterium]